MIGADADANGEMIEVNAKTTKLPESFASFALPIMWATYYQKALCELSGIKQGGF
jgi:hypothetical protein